MATSKRRTQTLALSNEQREVLTNVVRHAINERWDVLAIKSGHLRTASVLLDQLEHAIDIEITIRLMGDSTCTPSGSKART